MVYLLDLSCWSNAQPYGSDHEMVSAGFPLGQTLDGCPLVPERSVSESFGFSGEMALKHGLASALETSAPSPSVAKQPATWQRLAGALPSQLGKNDTGDRV